MNFFSKKTSYLSSSFWYFLSLKFFASNTYHKCAFSDQQKYRVYFGFYYLDNFEISNYWNIQEKHKEKIGQKSYPYLSLKINTSREP